MPKYKVFQESTGVSLYLEGDEEPGLEDIKRAFAFAGQQKYPNAPVLQEPTSLYEQAKSVAPSLARLASPLGYGRPTSQDVATAGRVLQQVSEAPGVLIDKALGRDTYRKPEEMLDAASRIEREGIMALGSASTEKRERAARIGRSLGETISEYTPIPEYVTRPAGEVFGQVSADLLSPMNVVGLGIAGAARQAVRIPALVAGTEFAESTTPAAVRAAQIADLTRTSEAAGVVDQAAKAIPRLLVPEITRGSAESAGIALQTISDPNATAEEKLKASYEALIGTLFAAGLGAEVARSLGVRGKKVTQVDILNDLASKKKTVGEAIGEVSGLLDQMDRIVPVENLKTQFRKYINELNPDEPFVYSKEPIGEGPRSRSRFVPDEERVAIEKENAFVEQQKKSQEANQQAALERSAEASGTPLKTVAELFEDRNRPPVMERKPSVTPEEASAVRRETVTPEPPVIKAEAAMPTGGTPLRSVEDLLAERLRTRDERIAVEAESARPETLTTAEGVQAQRAGERQALRERSAAIRKVLGRREFTAEELMRGEPTPEVPAEPVRSGEIITPEFTVERPAPREGGKLSSRESIEAEGTPLRSVEDILAERLRVRDERIAAEKQPAAQTSTPLETVEQKLSRALNAKDTRLASEAVAEALESGAARGEPVKVTRSSIEKSLGIGKKRAGQSAASEIIFNEVWDKALQETQGKFRQKAEGIAQKLEGLRTEVDVGLGANPFPQLMGAAWNGALMVAQAVIRAGGSVADGVAAGIRYARQNFKGKFDDAEFGSQLARLIERPSPVQVPTGMQPRRFAERVAAAPGVPPVIREAVAASPEASYKRQNLEQTKQEAAVKSASELTADIIDTASNTRVASSVELFNRQIASGAMTDASATALATAKNLTTWGQLINQAKLLNSTTREGIVYLVTKSMAERGKILLPEQATKLGDAMDKYHSAVDSIKRAEIQMKDAANKGDFAGEKIAAGLADMANAMKGEADVVLVDMIARLNPSTATDLFLSLVQGSVMAPISIAKNTTYNGLRLLATELADMTAAGIDAALFGGKNNSYDIRSRTLVRMEAFWKSLPAAKKIMLKGSDANPYELGTNIGNPLNFQRAWRMIAEDFASGNYGSAFSPRNLIEGTLGIYPDLLLRAAQATDIPFRRSDYTRIISEFGKKRGMSEAQIRVATRNPNLMLISDEALAKGKSGFTSKDLEVIEFESARSVYQQDNAATRLFAGANRFIRDNAGPIGYIPYRLMSLFQKTPINVTAEAVQFMPIGVFRRWGKLSQRERNTAVGRLIVGTMIGSAFYYLYDKGIVTPNLDTPGETNKARELAKSGGVMPPGVINTSGLRRLVSGGDSSFRPGDSIKDLSTLGTSGAIGMMIGTVRRLQERSRTDDNDLLLIGKGAFLSGLNYVMEQQFLKGTSDFIKLLSEESGNSLDRFLKTLSVTAASPLAPSILGAKRRAEREYLPAIGGEGFIRDSVNEINQRYAALGLAIPGAKDPNAMPVRRDLWGEAVLQTPKGENPWTYNFFDVWKSRGIEADPLNSSIYTLWRRTADNSAIPSVPNPKLTYKKQTFDRMSPEQFDRYTQLVGFYRRQASEYAFTHGAYQQGSDEVKLNILKDAYDRGFKIGKSRFIQELQKSGQTLTPVAARRGFQQPSE